MKFLFSVILFCFAFIYMLSATPNVDNNRTSQDILTNSVVKHSYSVTDIASVASNNGVVNDNSIHNIVEVYLASGQSNAKAVWAQSIEDNLNRLRTGPDIVVVHTTHPGAWLSSWWYNGSPQINYLLDITILQNKITDLINQGKTPVFKGLFWFQGEGDTGAYSAMNDYKERFNSIIDKLANDTGFNDFFISIVVIDINSDPFFDNPENSLGRTREDIEYMRSILFELAHELNGFAVDSRHYERVDLFHLPTDALISLGEYIAEKYYLDNIRNSYEFEINSIVRNTSTGTTYSYFTAPEDINNWRIQYTEDLQSWNMLSVDNFSITYSEVENKYTAEIDDLGLSNICFRILSP